MPEILTAFGRSVISQFHPKMLLLLVAPVLLAIVFWVVTALWLWTPITASLHGWLFDGGWLAALASWFASLGLPGFSRWTVALLSFLIVVPVQFGLAFVLVAVVVMPVVIHHLGHGAYRDVTRAGSFAVLPSLWNAVSSTVVFVLGYLVTLPLWLIPPLALIIPWLWWSWLTARLMRFDSLAEHADVGESRRLIATHRRGYFGLAMLVMLLNYIPPLFLVTPVLSALAFAHYSLALLRRDREPVILGGTVTPDG